MSQGHAVAGKPSGALQIVVADGLYAPEEVMGSVAVLILDGRIRAVWRETTAAQARERVSAQLPGMPATVVELPGLHLAPGFLDLHIHGYAGHDINTGTQDDLLAMARQLPATGTTSFVPTIASAAPDQTASAVSRTVAASRVQRRAASGDEIDGMGGSRRAAADSLGAEIIGARLEGPFIARAKQGAQDPDAIRPADPDELRRLVALGEGWVRLLDFAPDADPTGILLAEAVALGVVACIGHTNATYAQTVRAIDGGARHSTHLFNAMSPLTHRDPGVPGALLTDDRATVEVIADGVHLAPALLRLVLRTRGPRAVALVTDAMPAAGLPQGDYPFLGRTVSIRDGAARLQNGTLAGSTLTLDRAVRTMVLEAGCTWSDAIRMASATPAQIIGVGARKGHLSPGYDADLVAIDAHGYVRATWVRGSMVVGIDDYAPQRGAADTPTLASVEHLP